MRIDNLHTNKRIVLLASDTLYFKAQFFFSYLLAQGEKFNFTFKALHTHTHIICQHLYDMNTLFQGKSLFLCTLFLLSEY